VTRHVVAGVVLIALIVSPLAAPLGASQTPAGADPQGPVVTFRAAVEAVSIVAAVRDGRGRVVRDLKKSDFQVTDTGVVREIRDFSAGEAPISLAILLDISGSMAVGGNIDRARHAVAVITGLLTRNDDEAALFTFDATLQEVVAFTGDLERLRRVSLEGRPWGLTSLYDAVAAAAGEVGNRANRHRALLVITDGVDTGSRLTAPEVSGIASSIDVPVYLMLVVTPVDHPGTELSLVSVDGAAAHTATLADLARWTGGDMRITSVPAHAVTGARDIVAEMRYQYLITFEPDPRPGWHPLEVRTRNRNFTVHARAGYMSAPGRAQD
jgi:Ca-activated chloride channel family protein